MHFYRLKLKYSAQPHIHLRVKERNINILKRWQTDIKSHDITVVVHLAYVGGALLTAATLRVSVVCASAGMRAGTMLSPLVGLPLAYVSKILVNPIYRRKAVKRICGIIFNQRRAFT